MNIKYNFTKNNNTVSSPLTPVNLFRNDSVDAEPGKPLPEKPIGGLYPYQGNKPDYIFAKNIELINQRISQITKQLTYWDLYKLTYQVLTPTDLDGYFASLIPGQALVINCESFENNGQSYHRGDLVVKMLDGEAAYIPALTSGIFEPTKLFQIATKNNIQYYYYYWEGISIGTKTWSAGFYICSKLNPSDVLDDSGIVISDETLTNDTSGYTIQPNYQLDYSFTNITPKDNEVKTFRLNPSDIDQSFIYGIYQTLEIFNEQGSSFPVVFYEGRSIRPIIKCYNPLNEEVALSFTVELKEDENKWKVSWPESMPKDAGDYYIHVK